MKRLWLAALLLLLVPPANATHINSGVEGVDAIDRIVDGQKDIRISQLAVYEIVNASEFQRDPTLTVSVDTRKTSGDPQATVLIANQTVTLGFDRWNSAGPQPSTTDQQYYAANLSAFAGNLTDGDRITLGPAAFDARSGALAWAWDPMPPDHPATPPQGPYRRATANVWAPMSADAERGLLFVPTGNAPPDYFGGQREGLDHYASSVVALHTRGERAGEVAWHFQTVHHDLWDYDVGAQPSLIELNTAAGPVPAVVVSTKAGHVFVLHRESGEPLHPVEERPVPQTPAPGDWLSPTQPFPLRPPSLFPPELTPDDAWGLTFWDRGRCRRKIESRRSEGLYTPPSLEGTVVFPAATGGINWGGGAFDPATNLMVVNQSRVPTGVRLIPREEYDALPAEETRTDAGGLAGANRLYGEMQGTPYAVSVELLSSPLGMPCSAPPWGTLTAVDLDAGEIRWEVPLGSTRGLAPWPFWLEWGVPNVGGPIVTAGGLAFIAATPDRYIRAFDLASGETLWRADLPYAAHATPLTYRLGPERRQFLVVAAGGHVFSDPGDAIVAFALPEPE